MTKTLTLLFDNWWRPILFWLMTVVLVVASEIIKNYLFSYVAFVLLGIALVGLIATSIFQLIKKRWLKTIVTVLLFGGTIGAFILYGIVLFFIETVDGDKWADNLTIPNNIQLAVPAGPTPNFNRPDSLVSAKKSSMDLQLYNSFQPGIYKYDFWTGKIEKGKIYLKAYEITQEYALSKSTVAKSSSMEIYNPTDSIERFGSTGDFTIYEGDWGKYYAARFEVWFEPNGGGKERKLFQKNYKIEGWMR